MEFQFPIITFFMLMIVATNAEILPPQLYWKSMLPNSPIPKVIANLLLDNVNFEVQKYHDDRGATYRYGASKLDVNSDDDRGATYRYGASKLDVNSDDDRGATYRYGASKLDVNSDDDRGATYRYGASKLDVNSDDDRGATYRYGASKLDVNSEELPNLAFLRYVASETQLYSKPSATIFFFEKDLHHGKKSNLKYAKTASINDAKFLPRDVANSIPFSSNKVEYILNKLNIKKGSKGARIVKNTISECEQEGVKGEEKLCVTSLESMIDFITSKFGENIEALSIEWNNENEFQEYTIITQGVKKLGEKNKAVVCHKMNYPYAVFYCHKDDATKVYSVPLKGADGSRVKAIAVCHTDSSEWNPKYLAFQVLKVKPGTVPICHLLPLDTVVWISK